MGILRAVGKFMAVSLVLGLTAQAQGLRFEAEGFQDLRVQDFGRCFCGATALLLMFWGLGVWWFGGFGGFGE